MIVTDHLFVFSFDLFIDVLRFDVNAVQYLTHDGSEDHIITFVIIMVLSKFKSCLLGCTKNMQRQQTTKENTLNTIVQV